MNVTSSPKLASWKVFIRITTDAHVMIPVAMVTIHARRLTCGQLHIDGGLRNRVVQPPNLYPKQIDAHDNAVRASSNVCTNEVALVAAIPNSDNWPTAPKSMWGRHTYKAVAGSETVSRNAQDNPDMLSANLKFVRRYSVRKIKNEIIRYPIPRMMHNHSDIWRL